MTLAISTSGPYVTVALFDGGVLACRGIREGKRAASAAVLGLVEELGISGYSQILVDVGPGSFTGVRVGVAMAKTWAHMALIPLFQTTVFDLISEGPVAVPSKKGEVFARLPGRTPISMTLDEAHAVDGLLIAGEPEFKSLLQTWPSAIREVAPVSCVPLYCAPPAISVAKQSHIMGETFGGRRDV
ncbi:MAG: hypothetical protein JNM28_07255 [Armatimonadetes bacterium]|nr:hypothetical protein [Armatimonadota bacterium]